MSASAATITRTSFNRSSNFKAFYIITAIVLLASTGLTVMYSANRHIEGNRVRDTYRDGRCDQVHYFYSPKVGTMLVLCQMGEEIGGIVYRITENLGKIVLDAPYEATAFITSSHYWETVIVRDGYEFATTEQIVWFLSDVLPKVK